MKIEIVISDGAFDDMIREQELGNKLYEIGETISQDLLDNPGLRTQILTGEIHEDKDIRRAGRWVADPNYLASTE